MCQFHYRDVVHAIEEKDARDDKPHFDSDREVEDHREEECHDERRLIGKCHLAQAQEFAPVAHVPRDKNENGCERRERNIARKRGGGEDHD